jgi:hypothetical protein
MDYSIIEKSRKLELGIQNFENLRVCTSGLFLFYLYIPFVYGLQLRSLHMSDISVWNARW